MIVLPALAALRRIQDHIPAGDLAIQWDLPQEIAFLEGAASTPAWFTPVKEGILQRVLRLTDAVGDGVAMWFHFCYGDLGHRHFVEPRDTALLVEVGNAILKHATRSVDWIHLPVPKFVSMRAILLRWSSWNRAIRSFILDCCMRTMRTGRGRGSRLQRSLLGRMGLRLRVGWGDGQWWSWIAFWKLRRE